VTSPWWHDAVVYQIYVRSFADSNGDGVGDLPGIRGRLAHVADLGADAVWLTPFYRSPMADHGYDVADYRDVDPLFGTLEDLDKLLVEAHGLGLRVIVDLVPNHTSSEHAWFKQALADPTSDKRDWYVFRPPSADGGPPNNWTSVFGGPAWTLDAASGEYYLHLFDPAQPDLNWRNPAVHEAWEEILRFWLDRGVDGFRIDVAHGLYKDEELRDNPPPTKAAAGTEHLHSIGSVHTWNQPETLKVYEQWRRICDEYDERVMVGEVFLFDLQAIKRYVGRERLHQSFNFLVMATPFDAAQWTWALAQALDAFSVEGASPTWVLSNHDLVRHVTRYSGGEQGRRRGRAATSVLLALPGAPYLYQGEELGLEQSTVPPEARQDPIWTNSGHRVEGRDGCRTPIPWTSEQPGHGFTTGTPWLPFGADAGARSAQAQEADEESTLTFYRAALHRRRELREALDPQVTWQITPAGTLAFERRYGAAQLLTCVLNTSPEVRSVPVRGLEPELLLDSSAGSAALVDGGCAVPSDAAVWVLTSLDSPG
jgi:alpha-glucosidase